MDTVALIKDEVQNIAHLLVHAVIEEVEFLYGVRAETSEDHKDGIDERISMEYDKLNFHNVKLEVPNMPNADLNSVVKALAKELWYKEVNRLLDKYADQEPEYPINFRL